MIRKATGAAIASLLAVAVFASGCAGRGGIPYATGTHVELTRKNYRVISSNVIGQSSGFSFLGIVPILPRRYTVALTDLYSKAGMTSGKAQALVNLVEEKSTMYFILFSIPRLTIRADVVEFTE